MNASDQKTEPQSACLKRLVMLVPSEWEVREIVGGLEISAPTTDNRLGGGITLCWKTRRFTLGYGGRPRDSAPTYTGRGWQERMVTDAVKALDAALMPFRSALPNA